MATMRSIDKAASGYIRHRFVRALSASAVVAVVFGMTVFAVSILARVGPLDDMFVRYELGLLLVVVMMPLATLLMVALFGALIELLHRRILALVMLVTSLGVFLLSAILSVGVLVAAVAPASSEVPMPAHLFTGAVFFFVTAIVAYELIRHAWWQLLVSKESFVAIRGWRPRPWRLLTSLRRHIGLPGYLSSVGRRRAMLSVLCIGVAILNLGLVMMMAMPLSVDVARRMPESTVVVFVMGALLFLNLIGAGAWLAKIADRRAAKLYQNVSEWDVRAPIVFLRAFDQDAEPLRPRSADPFARWPAGVGRVRTLDEILLEHGSPYGPVIAIGDPRHPTPPLGAARVFVEGGGDKWQDVVRGLASASRAVIMCPNHSEGVQWELDLIAEGRGQLQTIFLASPELERDATLDLFNRLVPGMPEIPVKQWPIGAYAQRGEWCVLTARHLSVESYTAALNTALQALFGLAGVGLLSNAKAA